MWEQKERDGDKRKNTGDRKRVRQIVRHTDADKQREETLLTNLNRALIQVKVIEVTGLTTSYIVNNL